MSQIYVTSPPQGNTVHDISQPGELIRYILIQWTNIYENFYQLRVIA